MEGDCSLEKRERVRERQKVYFTLYLEGGRDGEIEIGGGALFNEREEGAAEGEACTL